MPWLKRGGHNEKEPVPAMLRRQVDSWADTWLKAKFSRLLELRDSPSGAARLSTSTSGTALGVAGQDDFFVRHTRMTLTGFGNSFLHRDPDRP